MLNERYKKRNDNDLNAIRQNDRVSDRFNLDAFKKILSSNDDTYRAGVYADQRLKLLGTGSSRSAYMLTSKKVIKIAINVKGIAQNEVEVDVFTDPETKRVVARIFDYDAKYKFIISELVHEFSDDDEAKKALGMKQKIGWYATFNRMMYLLCKEANIDDLIYQFSENEKNTKLENFLIGMSTMIDNHDLRDGDMIYNHFGRTSDGHVVILDYGYNDDVYEKYYM